MSPTLGLVRLLYRATINPYSLEPRRGVFFVLYYVIGAFAAFIVVNMLLLCLEAYDLSFARDLLYHELGKPALQALENLLF